MNMRKIRGFTVVELIVVVAVIGILAGITIVAYGTWQRRTAENAVKSDISQAAAKLEQALNFSNAYPATLSFSSSPETTVNYTRKTINRYSSLSEGQNATLFQTVCTNNMSDGSFRRVSDGAIYANTCNQNWQAVVTGGGIQSHTIYANNNTSKSGRDNLTSSATFVLYNSTYDAAYRSVAGSLATKIKADFIDQGGRFPVNILSNGGYQGFDPLPTPDSTRYSYCLQVTSKKYTNISYVVRDTQKTPQAGTC